MGKGTGGEGKSVRGMVQEGAGWKRRGTGKNESHKFQGGNQ